MNGKNGASVRRALDLAFRMPFRQLIRSSAKLIATSGARIFPSGQDHNHTINA
jgi:hypothetical protein